MPPCNMPYIANYLEMKYLVSKETVRNALLIMTGCDTQKLRIK